MNLNELKAFIEGFEHSFEGGAPSPEQWEIIKDKLYQVGEKSKSKPEDLFPIKREVVRAQPWQYPYAPHGIMPDTMIRDCIAQFEAESG